MNKIVIDLQTEIARGNLKKTLDDLFQLLAECKNEVEPSKEEVRTIRSNLLMLSGTFFDITNKFGQGVLAIQDYDLMKNRVRMSLIQLLDRIEEYEYFFNFLEDKEEEEEWEKATTINTISSYEAYFKKYPKGKYVEETEKIIYDLNAELRRKANEEKERRKVLKKFNYSNKVRRAKEPENQDAVTIFDWWNKLPAVWQKTLLNEIGSIGGVSENKIKRVMRLKIIDLSHNREVESLSPIQHLSSIRTLNLYKSRITRLDGIEHLTNLERLNIAGTQINDLRPLYHLKKIRSLVHTNLSEKQISTFSKYQPDCQVKNQN